MIDSVLGAVEGFYDEVLGNLRAWSASPPKLRQPHPPVEDIDTSVPSVLSSTDFSSQDDSTGVEADTAPGRDAHSGGGRERLTGTGTSHPSNPSEPTNRSCPMRLGQGLQPGHDDVTID